jgi:uncharacterized protein YkwD
VIAAISRRAFVVGAAAALAGCSSMVPVQVPTGDTTPAGLTTEVITAEINGTRKRYGAHPLKYNLQLEAAARTHARLMASKQIMSHTLGGSLRDRTLAAGYYNAVGENLGEGQKTLEVAIEAWLNSPGHKATLLNTRWVEFGLAASTAANGRTYWTFIAGGPFANWR